MTEKEIQTILDTLGNRVSQLSEDNRLHKLKSDSGKELFFQLKEIINSKDWMLLYESNLQWLIDSSNSKSIQDFFHLSHLMFNK